MVHLDAATAANAVTVISIANLSGRLVLGILSDKNTRIRVITIRTGHFTAYRYSGAAVRSAERRLSSPPSPAWPLTGGTITVFPSLVSEFFGLNNLAKNYGVIYLGFGIRHLRFADCFPVQWFLRDLLRHFALLILSWRFRQRFASRK